MLISVKIPTTYYADAPFVLNDKHGDLFYARNQGGYFNLPVGDYNLVKGYITAYSLFTHFPGIPQADPIRKTGMHIEAGVNPNKATFYAAQNKAVFDNFILDTPFKPARIFTMLHEEGHTYYRPPTGTMETLKRPFDINYQKAYKDFLEAECKCDIYAYNKMMRNGYNPSQIRYAITLIFKPDNERIEILDKQILEANNYNIV